MEGSYVSVNSNIEQGIIKEQIAGEWRQLPVKEVSPEMAIIFKNPAASLFSKRTAGVGREEGNFKLFDLGIYCSSAEMFLVLYRGGNTELNNKSQSTVR